MRRWRGGAQVDTAVGYSAVVETQARNPRDEAGVPSRPRGSCLPATAGGDPL
jgi:hypothetical protein